MLDLDGICKFPIPPMELDARLFMWRVGAMQEEALAVIRAWGFKLKAELIWIKTTQDGMLIIDEDGDALTTADFKPHRIPQLSSRIDRPQKLANIHFGMGHQVRYAHEVCLIATRGNPERTAHIRSVFFAPVPRIVRISETGRRDKPPEHSRKPQKFYELATSMSPGPYYEMFSRHRYNGWMCEGNELSQEMFGEA